MGRRKFETLEDIFLNDPIETARKKATAVIEEVKRSHSKETVGLEKTSKALQEVWGTPGKPEVAELLERLQFWSGGWEKISRKEVATALGVNETDIESYRFLSKVMDRAMERRVIGPRKALWKRLVKNVPITVLDHGSFPEEADLPFLVFFSADWCGPCQMIKPAFARLAPFFDKAKLYFYSSDTVFEEYRHLKFVPQLVAYLPNVTEVSSRCGGTAKELWQNMNLLITLGQSFEGKGELVCSDKECRIELKREA